MTPSEMREVVLNHVRDWSADSLTSPDHEDVYGWAQTEEGSAALIIRINSDDSVSLETYDEDGFAEPSIVRIPWTNIV